MNTSTLQAYGFGTHQPSAIQNRRMRRQHLQRSSNCRRSTPGRRVQVVPMGMKYTAHKAGKTIVYAERFRFIRHRHP